MLKGKNISLPQGAKDILPDEAEKIGLAEEIILSTFKRCGFKRIILPLVEYIDVLSLGMGSDLKEKVFKFIEPSTGRVVAISPDITPQVARVVATRMRDIPLPLKLCYNRSVLRLQDTSSGKSKEVLQIGAEYLTEKQTFQRDAEIIIVAIEALKALGLKDFKIDIGDVSFVRGIIDNLSIDEMERKRVKDAIALKDVSALERLLSKLGGKLKKNTRELIMSIPGFFGTEDVVHRAMDMAPAGLTKDALKNLISVLDIIDKKGLKDFITIDLGEIRGFDYYTGIIFEGFAHGVGKAILNGGRYDNLMAKYAYNCSATGFAFDIENLVIAMDIGT
ncbi:MAG: ATP phosphoribosyltransferase regulatory subunit [Thermodesulfobacteriota bacterium]